MIIKVPYFLLLEEKTNAILASIDTEELSESDLIKTINLNIFELYYLNTELVYNKGLYESKAYENEFIRSG